MSGIILSAVDLNSSHKNENVNCDENNVDEISVDIETDNIDQKITKQRDNNISIENENSSTRHRSPTTNSNDSNNISIVTLDENDDDSSVVDSDSDVEEIPNQKIDRITSPSGIVLVNKNIEPPNLCQSSVLCGNSDAKSHIGSIAVQNSSDITFGNKTFYQGPVTIKQFVYDKNKWKENETHAKENRGFVDDSSENLNRKEKDISVAKDHPDEFKKKWKYVNKQTLVSGIIAGALVCSLLTLILVIKYKNEENSNSSSKVKVGDGDDSRINEPISSSIGSDLITDTAGPLRVIPRGEWIAQPPANTLDKLVLPSTRVIIAHTATEDCTTQASCVYRVRMIQTFHMESKGWDDIGYNFLVGGDGAVYVGRGWDIQGAHTKGYNVKSICIAFIGTFNKIEPPKRQLIAAQRMIEEGVKLGKLTPDYSLYGHRQLIASESPGFALYQIIKTWKHWTEKIPT